VKTSTWVRDSHELFDYESYLRAKDTGSEMLIVGHLIKDAKGMRIQLFEEKQVETKK
jgi:hypothetical protein